MTFPEESSRSAGTDQKVRDVNFKRNSAAIRQMAEIDLLDQKTLEEKKIIGPGTTQKEFLNTFREIRTKLVQLSNKKNFVAMVNSVVDGGGASFTALNLAAVFALDKSKTALLPGWGRRPPRPRC